MQIYQYIIKYLQSICTYNNQWLTAGLGPGGLFFLWGTQTNLAGWPWGNQWVRHPFVVRMSCIQTSTQQNKTHMFNVYVYTYIYIVYECHLYLQCMSILYTCHMSYLTWPKFDTLQTKKNFSCLAYSIFLLERTNNYSTTVYRLLINPHMSLFYTHTLW